MKVLLLGGTGATGKLLLEQLLTNDVHVKALLRSQAKIPEHLLDHANLEIIKGSISDSTEKELEGMLDDCDAAASCLGHNMSLKGIFGKPRRLVTHATKTVAEALIASNKIGIKKLVLPEHFRQQKQRLEGASNDR